MKILIVGADGRTGKLVLDEAASRDHEISTLSRTVLSDKKAHIKKAYVGDATDYGLVKESLNDIDVVISVVGHTKKSSSDVQSKIIRNYLKAFQSKSKSIKLVSLTGSGVRVTGDKVGLVDKLLNGALYIVDKERVIDGINHYQIMRESGNPWVLLRVLKLTNGKKQGYSLTTHGPVAIFSSRLTVASALLDLAEDDKWNYTAPLLSK